jgi:hypothetical protein
LISSIHSIQFKPSVLAVRNKRDWISKIFCSTCDVLCGKENTFIPHLVGRRIPACRVREMEVELQRESDLIKVCE